MLLLCLDAFLSSDGLIVTNIVSGLEITVSQNIENVSGSMGDAEEPYGITRKVTEALPVLQETCRKIPVRMEMLVDVKGSQKETNIDADFL